MDSEFNHWGKPLARSPAQGEGLKARLMGLWKDRDAD